MREVLSWCAIFAVFVLVAGCGKPESSRCNSQCARCGRSRHVRSESGRPVADEVRENDLSRWLAQYRSTPCTHVWIPVSGWSSRNNEAWDGVSHWDRCLRHIKELHPAVGETETAQLLERYHVILDMDDGPERGRKLDELGLELKAKLKQTR